MKRATEIGTRSRALCSAAVFGFAALLSGCADPAGPESDVLRDVSITPRLHWAGGVVTATSPAFANVELIAAVDSSGSDRPNRWQNLAILVGGDTVDSWRDGSERIAFRLPNPARSGTASVEVVIDTTQLSTESVDVIGNAYAVRVVLCAEAQPCEFPPTLEEFPFLKHGVGLGAGQLLAHFTGFSGGDVRSGIAIAGLDDAAPTVRWLEGLEGSSDFGGLPGLVAPGRAHEAGSWIVDLSAADTAVQPVVWDFVPPLSSPGPLACLPEGVAQGYAVTELPSGECLLLTGAGFQEPGTLTRNGTTPIQGYGVVPWEASAGCATFVNSEGNRWTTLRSMRDPQFCNEGLSADFPAWPVLDADGNVSFSTSRYLEWPTGADFTRGDTLWVIGKAQEWTLDAWEPVSGELLLQVPLPDATRCEALLVDPVRPYVFAACRRSNTHGVWPGLVVYDRSAAEVVAVLETKLPDAFTFPPWSPFTLVYGGSSGRVHLTAVWDGTTAAAERGVMVASYDTF